MSSTCKEQCTKCKCIVQERELNVGHGGHGGKKNDDYNGNGHGNESKIACVEAYRDLGECLQRAIMAASKTQKKDDGYDR